jgi:hypothetical protein
MPYFFQFLQAYKEAVESGKPLDSSDFLHQGDEKLTRVVTELITHRYSTSKNWEKFHIVIPKDSDELKQKALSNVLHLKFRIIQRMLDTNLKAIQSAENMGDLSELEKALMQQDTLKQAERQLAATLGIVVAR